MPGARSAPTGSGWRGLLAALAIDNLGSGLFLPLVLVYATQVMDVALGTAGSVLFAATCTGLVVPALAGRVVDRIGPKVVVVASQVLQALGAGGFLLAEGPVGLLLAAIPFAAGQQLFYSGLFSLVADVSDAGPKDKAFALVGMVRGAAFGTGALMSAVLLSSAGAGALRAAVAVHGIALLLAAGVLVAAVRPRRHRTDPQSQTSPALVLRDRPFLRLIAATGAISLTASFFLVGFPVLVLEVLDGPSWLPGTALALLTVVSSPAGTAAVRVTARLPRTTVMQIAAGLFALWGLTCLVAPAVPAAWLAAWLLLGVLVLSVGNVIMGARANALAEASAPPGVRGRYLAAFQYAFTLPTVAAPLLVSLFAFGAWAPWVLLVPVCLAGMVAMRGLARSLPARAVAPLA